jgi:hypothetical protein
MSPPARAGPNAGGSKVDRHSRLNDQLADAMAAHLATGETPKVPEAGRLLWSLFVEISASRTYHAAGPHPLSFAEIEAWARLFRWPLQPHHLAAIRAIDDAWLAHAFAKIRPPAGGRTYARKGPAMTPEMFDAVFG